MKRFKIKNATVLGDEAVVLSDGQQAVVVNAGYITRFGPLYGPFGGFYTRDLRGNEGYEAA